ncbi:MULTISPECIES: methylated-DNA--[protein]-cysteine S-methyltransferase [unclassified Lentimonas]|uniref:methylated-DNA--[protein]-cysteine S-methyltransferase n=1 Tax=unclassified Lentimonas TaxID=2630993 RepID=UPI001328AF9E|nr:MULTISPECIES: MGMT family protein [unclassified Lentimonas]CAA6696652.1 Unannotated [Lentimonas sp. CC19]CAA6697578.1 Unannotated [Lentimonas sp. CC10]CAA7069006.1 Methylated-DNA--protein-cysteine methyltransferase (EC [Lentimonas sp. CC11]
MASLNDNLFTTLVNYTTTREFGCYLQTCWGALKVNITPKGVESITFEDGARPEVTDDSVFRAPFMDWLSAYLNTSTDGQWRALCPQGTDFQQTVWRALLDIPIGEQMTYKQIATNIDQPNASRAVGSAIAANPIALLIPCHRVVPQSGGPGNYRWGPDRKFALLEAERLANASVYQLFQ